MGDAQWPMPVTDKQAIGYALSTIASWRQWGETGGPSLGDALNLIQTRRAEARAARVGERPAVEWPEWVFDVMRFGPLAELETEWRAEMGDAITRVLDERRECLEREATDG